jgi:adenylosuccinate lyase
MTVHLIDSTVFGNSVGDPVMREIFSERAMLQSWLDTEVALAKAQAELGMIPKNAAGIIAAGADISKISLEAVQAHGARTGHSLLGLLAEFRQVINHAEARYVHFGATTQDIIDTGLMLMIKKAYQFIVERLADSMSHLCKMVAEHSETVMVGRTHGGHALPITFGFKASIWLSELSRHMDRWMAAKERILVGNLTGAVGTFASWGDKGVELQQRSLNLLGLGAPETVWHSSRDRVAEIMTLCSLLAATAGRIAREIYNLSKTEFGELVEPGDGKIGSSTMPHKKNPVHSEWIMVLERGIRANASTCVEVMGQENERDASRWKNEWILVPETFVFLSGVLNHLQILMKGLSVQKERMRQNVDILRGMLLSEPVMFLLEKHFPLPEAHERVYAASVRATENKTHLVDELLVDEQVAEKIERSEIEARLDPGAYLGSAPQVAIAVKNRVENQLAKLDFSVLG